MIKLFNSLTKTKEPFDLPKDKPLTWYTCGPTVYDSTHLGHARTYMTFDIIMRVLRHYGYTIFSVVNITDIDDKIINKLKENNKNITDFTSTIEADFWKDMDTLNVTRPVVVTRVSEYIEKMKTYIDTIISNKLAYESNGSVYFDSEEFMRRGLNLGPLKAYIEDDYTENTHLSEKRHKNDFALWKKSDGLVTFDYKDSKGRPGWHLECSVMATDVLGTQLDVHAGGVDLAFPHHNNEILQVQAHNNCDLKWTKFFLHSGHLNIEGLKMSKSLKNFITVREFLDTMGTPRQLRLLFLMHRWDRTLDYSKSMFEETVRVEKRLENFMQHVQFLNKNKKTAKGTGLEYMNYVVKLKVEVDEHLRDNINTPEVMRVLLDAIAKTYVYLEEEHNLELVNDFNRYLVSMLTMFGLEFTQQVAGDTDKFVDLAVNLREDVRNTLIKHKKSTNTKEITGDLYKLLDDFRDNKLKGVGIKLQDVKDNCGSKWAHINII
jgi:cysteinyl-tRNA synthetase